MAFKEKPGNIVVTREDIEPFLQAQQAVADYLQAKHYRAFLLSDFYRSFVIRWTLAHSSKLIALFRYVKHAELNKEAVSAHSRGSDGELR